jgi:hypothetical protein
MASKNKKGSGKQPSERVTSDSDGKITQQTIQTTQQTIQITQQTQKKITKTKKPLVLFPEDKKLPIIDPDPIHLTKNTKTFYSKTKIMHGIYNSAGGVLNYPPDKEVGELCTCILGDCDWCMHLKPKKIREKIRESREREPEYDQFDDDDDYR